MSALLPGLERGLVQVVGPGLDAGETPQAFLTDAISGSSPPFFALFALVALVTGRRSYGLVLTDRRLLVVERSKLTGRALRQVAAYSRDDVVVRWVRHGVLWGSIRLGISGQPDLNLNIRRPTWGAADNLAKTLGAPSA